MRTLREKHASVFSYARPFIAIRLLRNIVVPLFEPDNLSSYYEHWNQVHEHIYTLFLNETRRNDRWLVVL